MTRGLPFLQSARPDDPWRRLPGVLLASLLMWGILLWGFGLLLGKMVAPPQEQNAIEVQLLEVPAPVMPVLPVPKPIRQIKKEAPKPPEPLAKPIVETPVPPALPQPESVVRPIVGALPAPNPPERSPAVKPEERPSASSVRPETARRAPESTAPSPTGAQSGAATGGLINASNLSGFSPDGINLPVGHGGGPGKGQPGFETRANISSQASPGSNTPPRLGGAAYLSNPKPAYPASAKRRGMEGTVILKVLVSREGRVLKIETLRSSGYEILDEAAAAAVKNWRFVPARRGDSPVDDWVQVPLTFRLNK